MNKNDYYELTTLPSWITISEEDYKPMKHKVGHPLPTMAISTIKYDKDGNPKRAKYRIAVLGHLDSNTWERSDTYAPVLSLIELQLMITLGIHGRRIMKSGDFKQAFCQVTLPPDEQYVLKPPAGCPISEPNTFWLIKRNLYGLKRSPKHWFEKATENP